MVAAGLGVSALPALVRALVGFADVDDRPIGDPIRHRRLDVVLPSGRGPSPAGHRFLCLLDELRGTGFALPYGVDWV